MDKTNLLEIKKIINSIKYKNCILVFSHSNYTDCLGGTEKFMKEQQLMLAKREISYIHFFIRYGDEQKYFDPKDTLIGVNIDSKLAGYFIPEQVNCLLDLITSVGINVIETNIHHTKGFDFEIIKLILQAIDKPIKFFLHDYFSVCPQYNLLKDDKAYCGGSSENSTLCNTCIYGNIKPNHYRKFYKFFSDYNVDFIAPSHVAKDVWVKGFPEFNNKVRVVPHQVLVGEYEKKPNFEDKIKIAYVGYQSPIKGWEQWKDLVENIDINKYRLYHFGKCDDLLDNVEIVEVSFVTEGSETMQKKLRQYDIDIVILFSIWPETYSYTYFESYAAGCFVITSEISGNIAAQVKKNENGIILNNSKEIIKFFEDEKKIRDKIINNAKKIFPMDLKINEELPNELKEKCINNVRKIDFNLINEAKLNTFISLNEKSESLCGLWDKIDSYKAEIQYLQMKHYEKDCYINSLTTELQASRCYKDSNKATTIKKIWQLFARMVKKIIRVLKKIKTFS